MSEKLDTGKYIFRTADIGDYQSVDKAVQSIWQELGSIDILIDNVSTISVVSQYASFTLIGWPRVGSPSFIPGAQRSGYPHDEQDKCGRYDADNLFCSESWHEKAGGRYDT